MSHDGDARLWKPLMRGCTIPGALGDYSCMQKGLLSLKCNQKTNLKRGYLAGIWKDEIIQGYKLCYQILADITAYMKSLVCEGRPVAAAVVARLRFSVESVPVMGALESSQDESFTITACLRYCRDQEQADPLYWNAFSSFLEHWAEEDRSVTKKKKKSSWKRSVKCEHWNFDVRLRGRSDSVMTVTEEGWGVRGNVVFSGWTFPLSSSRGGNGFSFSVHFIPFLMVPF